MKICLLVLMSVVYGISYSQNYDWFPISSSVNNSVKKLIEYDGKLIAAGDFTMADGISVASIAAWDGTTWSALGDGIIYTYLGNYASIQDMIVFHDSLFVVGQFDYAGGLPANNIAVWDGNSWSSLGSGSNKYIEAIEIFNDTLYVAGDFDTIGGIPANNIAKWTGANWVNLGKGLRTDSGGGIALDLEVYNNQLYATGFMDSAGTIACNNVACWDGSAWGTIPASTGFLPCYQMIVWNFELLFATPCYDTGDDLTTEIVAWDGTGFYSLSWEPMPCIYDFIIYNNELYCGGNDFNYNYGNDVRKWNGTNWESAGTGLSYVNTFCIYNNVLYAGGSFSTDWGYSGDYISRYAELNSIDENELENNFKVYPNPVSDLQNLNIKNLNNQHLTILILTPTGQIIKQIFDGIIMGDEFKLEVDLSELSSGTYFYKIQTEETVHTISFVKN